MNSSFAQHDVNLLSETIEMKRIYSVIEHTLFKNNAACMVVTSGVPGEGKTTVVAGLSAIGAVQRNLRVLAVDLNWYRPDLHKWFGLTRKFDANDFGQGKSLLDLVQSTHLKNLDILTATSTPHPDIVMDEDVNHFGRDIIRQACAAYDVVIVDASSIFPVNHCMMDPVAVSMEANAAILVTLANVTPRQKIKRARMLLEAAGVHVAGIVVNQWKNILF
jgi:Mrp family chromosome partitioning ATPase